MSALDIAISQLGVEEKPRGSNWGEEIQKYLASVDVDFPAAWCMAFIYWCVEESGIRIPDGAGGLKNPLVKTAGVLRQWNEVGSQFPLNIHKKMKQSSPEPGDIFIMDHGHGRGHAGFVESMGPDGMINTVEGNTNDEGDREGYEVCRRSRSISGMKGFIRIPSNQPA